MGNEQQGSNMNLQIQGYSGPQIRVRVWIVLSVEVAGAGMVAQELRAGFRVGHFFSGGNPEDVPRP